MEKNAYYMWAENKNDPTILLNFFSLVIDSFEKGLEKFVLNAFCHLLDFGLENFQVSIFVEVVKFAHVQI